MVSTDRIARFQWKKMFDEISDQSTGVYANVLINIILSILISNPFKYKTTVQNRTLRTAELLLSAIK